MAGFRAHVVVEVEAHVGRGAVGDQLDEVTQVLHLDPVELLELHVEHILIAQRRIARQNLPDANIGDSQPGMMQGPWIRGLQSS